MSEYTDSVAHYLEGLDVDVGFCPGCRECGCDCEDADSCDCDPDVMDEGHFSWSQCDGCGSRFGGDRYSAHGITREGKILHLDVCSDCLMYLANGEEPEEWSVAP